MTLNKRNKTTLYDIQSHNIDSLRHYIGTFDWSKVFLCFELQARYVIFLQSIKSAINSCMYSHVR